MTFSVDGIRGLLSLAKDALVIGVIILVGWRYLPMLFNPALTSDFEISEINLLVVKLKPQGSEIAIEVVEENGANSDKDAVGANEAGSTTGSHSDTWGDAPRDTPRDSSQPPRVVQQGSSIQSTNSSVTYLAQKRVGQDAPDRVVIPSSKIMSKGQALSEDITRGWTYLGKYKNKSYSDLTFNLDQNVPPNKLVGMNLSASTSVFIRDDKPRFVLGWSKGDRVGVLPKGSKAHIKEIELIPVKGGGSAVWVKI